MTDKTAVKNITEPRNIWNDDANVKLRPKYITFYGYQTIDQSEINLIRPMRSENRPEVALMSHMAGISNKNGLYNLLSYVKYS